MSRLWKTKSFWGGVAAIATGVGMILAGNKFEGASAIWGGLMAIFLRDGIRKAEVKAPE